MKNSGNEAQSKGHTHTHKTPSSPALSGLRLSQWVTSVTGYCLPSFPRLSLIHIHTPTYWFVPLLSHSKLSNSGLAVSLATLSLTQKARIGLIHLDFGPPGSLDQARLALGGLAFSGLGGAASRESEVVSCESPGPRPGMALVSVAEGVSLGVIR